MLNFHLSRQREPDLVETLPRTQTQVRVVEARESCLIDCDKNVIAAVGVASLDTSLQSDEAVTAKIEHYREFLKTLRYPIQFLIGTRPQDLSPFQAALAEREDRLELTQQLLKQAVTQLDGYLALPAEQVSEAGFEQFFGWHPNTLIGTPGEARTAVLMLCDPARATALTFTDIGERFFTTIRSLARWRDILVEHADLVSDTVQRAQAPVRTYFIVTSTNPRLVMKSVSKGALTEREFRAAKERLDDRCRQIFSGLQAMGVACWRASHEDLLLELRHFFNPGLSLLARRDANQMDDLDLPNSA